MVEIIAIIRLCMINSRNAKAAGRKGWHYVLITIALWLGLEFFGALAAGIVINLIYHEINLNTFAVIYTISLLFGLSGGIMSYFLAKRKNPPPKIGTTRLSE